MLSLSRIHTQFECKKAEVLRVSTRPLSRPISGSGTRTQRRGRKSLQVDEFCRAAFERASEQTNESFNLKTAVERAE